MHYARIYRCALVLFIVGTVAVSCIADVALHLHGLISRPGVVPVHDVVLSILPDLASVIAAFLCCFAARCASDEELWPFSALNKSIIFSLNSALVLALVKSEEILYSSRLTKTRLTLALAFTAISLVLHLGFVVVVVLDYFGVSAHLHKLMVLVIFNRDSSIEVGFYHCFNMIE